MKSNTLTLESLVVARDGAALTAPISLKIAGGQMLAIHGNNGSGKSTLLKMVAGLLPVYRGRILYSTSSTSTDRHPGEGRDDGLRIDEPSASKTTWDISPRPLYLGHKRGLTPSMSVYDNVAFWARASGYPELTAAAMRYFDLDDIPDAAVESLSAGWQQRVALTRLITMPRMVWLLDEPTANLDAEAIGLLQSLIRSRLEQGGIILVATHMQLQGGNITTLNLSRLDEKAEVKVA